MKDWINKYFNEEELTSIKNEIAEVEKNTSGEIRVCFRHKRKLFENRERLHEAAIKEFHSLGMHKTKNKTGVLIFILFNDKYFDVVADEGIHNKIPDSMWKKFEDLLRSEFRKEKYSSAIIHVIKRVGETLTKEFPLEAGDRNELPDDAVIR